MADKAGRWQGKRTPADTVTGHGAVDEPTSSQGSRFRESMRLSPSESRRSRYPCMGIWRACYLHAEERTQLRKQTCFFNLPKIINPKSERSSSSFVFMSTIYKVL